MAITVKTIPDTSYTLLDADDGLLLRFTAATAVTVSCPDTLSEGFTSEATQAGAGQVTFIKIGSTQFVDVREPTLRGTGAHCAITLDGDALYKFNGEFTVATFLSLINKNAIIAPTVNDDETLSYSVGSTWFDNTAGNIYDCTDASSGAAVWLPRATNLSNQVIVRTASDFGVIDSTKEYFIDGVIDMTGVSIEIPVGGISLRGYNLENSRLECSDNTYDMFYSTVGGCGNVLAQDVAFEASGTSSQVWNLTGATGFEAFEFSQINYNNCTKVGTINNFRQGLESGSGRFGGTPTLELVGTWLGGFRITTSIVRSLDAGMTDPLFKAGAGFTMSSRFLSDINCDLPSSASLADFSNSNFSNPSSVQMVGAILTRNGTADASDSNIFPNLLPTELACSWRENVGLPNTNVGGKITVTAEAATSVSLSTWTTALGTFTPSYLSHFDEPSNGQIRHLGDDPREYLIFTDLELESSLNNEVGVRFMKWDDSASSESPIAESEQIRQINNTGSTDKAFFHVSADVTLDKNDYVYLQVINNTDTNSITVLDSSYFRITVR
jgi:hypothetical protein